MFNAFVAETHLYFSRHPKDLMGKIFVGSLCAIDTLNSALISHALYYYLVLLFPSTKGLNQATLTYCVEISLSFFLVFIVQLVYAHHVWQASRNMVLVGTIVIISTAAWALGIVMMVEFGRERLFSSLGTLPLRPIVTTMHSLVFLSTAISCAALCLYNKTPHISLADGLDFDNIYHFFLTYAVSRGSITALVQLAYWITFAVAPSSALWMPFHLLSSKLAINSLLTSLNSREHRQGGSEQGDITEGTSTSLFSGSGPRHVTSTVRFDDKELNTASEGDKDIHTKDEYEQEEADPWHRSMVSRRRM